MEVEIQHKPQMFYGKCKLKWELVNNGNIRRMNIYFYIALGFFVLSIIFLSNKSAFGWVIGTAALMIIAYYFYFINSIKKLKKEYFDKVKEVSEYYLKSEIPIKYLFSEENIGYSDCLHSFNINWTFFKSYSIIENVLYLKRNENYDDVIDIGKDEVGDENFTKIIEFVKTKIK
ncbi:MAG: hypothetical protein ACXWEY_01820 [Bacteroidia bacterium]